MEHVVFVGGGTGGGKSTLARGLAERHGLRVYRIDDRWYAHDAILGEPPRTPDEQWLDTPPERVPRDVDAEVPPRAHRAADAAHARSRALARAAHREGPG